jgi:hypothetical protein
VASFHVHSVQCEAGRIHHRLFGKEDNGFILDRLAEEYDGVADSDDAGVPSVLPLKALRAANQLATSDAALPLAA